MLKTLKDKSGFISVETVIVAGLMIGLGVFAIVEFYGVADSAVQDAVLRVDQALDVTTTK